MNTNIPKLIKATQNLQLELIEITQENKNSEDFFTITRKIISTIEDYKKSNFSTSAKIIFAEKLATLANQVILETSESTNIKNKNRLEKISHISLELKELANKIRTSNNIKITKEYDSLFGTPQRLSLTNLDESINTINLEFEKLNTRQKIEISNNREKIKSIEQTTTALEEQVSHELEKTKKLYTDAEIELNRKNSEIDKLLGVISGTAIASSYETSATHEKTAADWLRYASLACMFTIVIIVGYSFWETTKDTFDWKNTTFRIALALILSLPSAYLARESGKHREKHYHHLQTSLDMRTINPFIASLSQEQQNTIKAEIASRIFINQEYPHSGNDSYPINVHDLLNELIKRIKISS